MKIGILTFHWATNYGAILQCYALQNYLESKGHEVKVINYKPKRYDESLYKFVRYRKFLNLYEYFNKRRKERALSVFRNAKLHLTERIYSFKEMPSVISQFDAIISGSDQVCNSSFLMSGEGKGIVSPTYFLGFPFDGKRIGYALSFGCVTYPKNACRIAANYIKDFDIVTVREKTGVDIVKSMGRDDAIVVPDPTLLMPPTFYHTLANSAKKHKSTHFIYSFFIRHIMERKNAVNSILKGNKIIWNNDDGDYTIEGWLNKIKHADFVVTDSFHCVVMCLKLHTPFVVVTEQKGNIGMNDRLYTLLDGTIIENRIVYKGNIDRIKELSEETIDWDNIELTMVSKVKSIIDVFS